MIPQAQQFLLIIKEIAYEQKLSVDVVGSFATGLWSSTSDIDISLVPIVN